MKIAVLGSGGWGTALAMLLAENGHTVTLWSYLEEESRRLQQTRENPLLPGVTLPESPAPDNACHTAPAENRRSHEWSSAPPSPLRPYRA